MDAVNYGDEGNLTFKSYDLNEVKAVRGKAKRIIKKYYPNNADLVDSLTIVTQPECPKCGELGKFSDTYCPKCGAKLTERRYID